MAVEEPTLRITVNIARTGPALPAIAKQELYALSQAINKSLDQAQTAQRNAIATNFIDRKRGFLARLVKIGPGDRATRANPVGRISITGPEQNPAAAQILTRHETGGVQSAGGVGYSIDPSVRIGGFFYIPTESLRSPFSATIPTKLYPKSLHILERRDVVGVQAAHVHRTSTGAYQLKGDDRTFVLFGANGGGPIGIFQRRGTSAYGRKGHSRGRRTVFGGGGSLVRDDIQAIWLFHRTLTLKPRLHFYEVVPQTIQETLVENFFSFLPGALATAK